MLYLQDLEPILEIIEPDVLAFVVERFDRGLVWKLRNDSEGTINRVRAQVLSVQSFNSNKRVFKPPESVRASWVTVPELKSGYETKPVILVATDAERITIGSAADEYIPWPNADHSIERRWLVKLKIAWDFGEWPLDLDIGWRVGTKQIEIAEYRSVPHIEPANDDGKRARNIPTHRPFAEKLPILDGLSTVLPEALTPSRQPPRSEIRNPSTLSSRDTEVHNLVGAERFRTLTNAEIMRDPHLKKQLRQYSLKPNEDASKSCLDRIRRAKSYPLSRNITEKRSSRS